MSSCFVYPIRGYHTLNKNCNPIRCLQLLLCALCLILGVICIVKLTASTVLFVLIAIAPITMLFIVSVDMDSMKYQKPIFWNSWLMIAIGGALLFFMGAGLLLFMVFYVPTAGLTIFCIIALVAYIVTAVVFLIDAIAILRMLCQRTQILPEERVVTVSRQERVEAARPQSRIIEPERDDDDRSIQVPCDETYQPCRPIVVRRPCYCKPKMSDACTNKSVTSYGGTFHVSKDAPPLPSPQPSPQLQPRAVQASQQCRTVAVSTRTVPKTYCGIRPQSSPAAASCSTGSCATAPSEVSRDTNTTRRPARSANCADAPSPSYNTSVCGSHQPEVVKDLPKGCGQRPQQQPQPQQQQQQPEVIYHQYVQNPCTCGKMHFKSVSTVQGNVVSAPGEPAELQQLQYQECKHPRRCVNRDCPCFKQYHDPDNASISPRRNGLDEDYVSTSPRRNLQPIIEDREMDSVSNSLRFAHDDDAIQADLEDYLERQSVKSARTVSPSVRYSTASSCRQMPGPETMSTRQSAPRSEYTSFRQSDNSPSCSYNSEAASCRQSTPRSQETASCSYNRQSDPRSENVSFRQSDVRSESASYGRQSSAQCSDNSMCRPQASRQESPRSDISMLSTRQSAARSEGASCGRQPSARSEPGTLGRQGSRQSSIRSETAPCMRQSTSSAGGSCSMRSASARSDRGAGTSCKRDSDDDEVQTSETRMIRARDLEKIAIPGSADRSPSPSRR